MIEIKHVTKTFGTKKAVDDLDLTIPTGEIIGFIGPNGAGKTTTIKMMTGVLNPVVGALVHNAGSVAVILHSAFLLKWKKKMPAGA